MTYDILLAILLAQSDPSGKPTSLFTFDLGTAVAVGTAVGSGIAFAAKILVSYFKQRDDDKDRLFQERNTQWQQRFTESDNRYNTLANQMLAEIQSYREEKREETQMFLGILKDTITAVSEIKQQFLETNEKMRNENVKAMGEIREVLAGLISRVNSWETKVAKPG